MNNSINLLDYKNKIQPKHINNKQRSLRIVAISLLFIVSLSSIIFFILVALSPLPQLRKQEKIASFSLSTAHADIVKLALIKDRADDIQELVDKRPYFDKVLNSIQTKLPSSVSIDSVDINPQNFSVTLASNSLKDLDTFLNALTEDGTSIKNFSQVKIVSLSSDEKKNGFLLTVNMNFL